MSRLVDPTICPDCRAALDPAARCTGCGLVLTGPRASELWLTLQRADALVSALRQGPDAAPTSAATRADLVPRPARRLPGISVPVVLLGLGALCLLVAAIVFAAVAWSSLTLTAKTAILLAVTGLFAGLALLLTRKLLRLAAETFWLIALAMVALDVLAAAGAGLLGLDDVSGRHVAGIVGVLVLVLSILLRRWSATTELGALAVPVVTAGLAALALTAGEAWAHHQPAPATAISIGATLLVVVALIAWNAAALTPVAGAVGAVTTLSWLTLVVAGIDRAADVHDAWWSDLRGWPLLAASAYAALLASAPRHLAGRPVPLPDWIRGVAGAGCLVGLSIFLLGPSSSVDLLVSLGAGTAVLLATVSAFAPRVWSIPAGMLSLVALLASGVVLAFRPLDVVLALPVSAPRDDAHLDLVLTSPQTELAPWTAPLLALTVLVCLVGLIRHLGDESLRNRARSGWLALAPALLATGGATLVLEQSPTLLVAAATWAGALVVSVGAAAVVRRTAGALVVLSALAGYQLLVGLRLTAPSHLLTAVLATLVCAGATVAHRRAEPDLLRNLLHPVLGGLAVGLGWIAAASWPFPLDGGSDAAAIAASVFCAVTLVGAEWLARGAPGRVVIETAAVLLGLASAVLADRQEVVALTLTVIGSAVALTSLLHRDRESFSWVGVVILAAATGYRVGTDAAAPELYALPAALALVAVGGRRLLREPDLSSIRALGSGLVLALVPSLLLALDDPVSWRGVLIGAAGVLVLAAGVLRRWAAPFAAGSVVVAALAVRHLGPVAEALPRWITLTALGLGLLVVGITWEARRRNLGVAARYLGALR